MNAILPYITESNKNREATFMIIPNTYGMTNEYLQLMKAFIQLFCLFTALPYHRKCSSSSTLSIL
jgi:hypothetical protein